MFYNYLGKLIPIFKFSVEKELENSEVNFLPTRAYNTDTGWDVRANTPNKEPLYIKLNEYVKINLGIRCFAPKGWWLELKPRSSTFAKKYLHCLYGTIDETYSGILQLAVTYRPTNNYCIDTLYTPPIRISHGEAIAQIIPVKRKEMFVQQISNEEFEKLCKDRNSQRGDGGFGSTTK